ncbi:MAG: type II toxin-antitoxin system VapC family toxin [Vulcanimicrobiota bacterium]
MLYVLDTNTAIYYFKGVGRVASHLLAQAPRQIGLSAVVEYELLVGIEKSTSSARRRLQLQALKSAVTYLPFAEEEARQAARLRARLEKSGTPIGPYDVLIAASALARGATLVTHNLKEFSRVPSLQTVDWF